MHRRTFALVLVGLAVVVTASSRAADPAPLELSLQSRDRQGKVIIEREKVNPAQVGVVVVDMWNPTGGWRSACAG